jgi:hypothetical protein
MCWFGERIADKSITITMLWVEQGAEENGSTKKSEWETMI